MNTKWRKRLLLMATTVLLTGFYTMNVSATEIEGDQVTQVPEIDEDQVTQTPEIEICDHTYTSVVTTAPTCTETGVETFTCSKCGDNYTETVLETGHSYKTTIKKATTSKNGSVTVKCEKCNDKDKNKSYTIYKPKKMKLSKNSVSYTGKAIKPSVTITDTKGKKIKKANYKVSYWSNKNVGTATVIVTFKGKNYSGKLKKTFTITPKTTSIEDIKAEENGFTIKWKAQTKQVNGYQIQYSTKKNFKNAKSIWIKPNIVTEKRVYDLQEQTKYYVRIRSFTEIKVNGKSKKFYSAWSSAEVTTQKNYNNYSPYKLLHIYDDGGVYVYFYFDEDMMNYYSDINKDDSFYYRAINTTSTEMAGILRKRYPNMVYVGNVAVEYVGTYGGKKYYKRHTVDLYDRNGNLIAKW